MRQIVRTIIIIRKCEISLGGGVGERIAKGGSGKLSIKRV